MGRSRSVGPEGRNVEGHGNIPDVVIRRLPIYARALEQLLETGTRIVSSGDLAAATGNTAAQIRRDLSYFGEFGKAGRGYDGRHLLEAIRRILHLQAPWKLVLVGAGALGQAVARYTRFAEQGFQICRVYDHNPKRIGTRLNGLTVEDVVTMPKGIREEGILLAVLAVPAASAQAVADSLVESGVKAILNYAPVSIQVPDDVRVQDIDPVAALQTLTYYVTPPASRSSRPISA